MDNIDDITVAIGGDFCPIGRPQYGLLNGTMTAEAIVSSARMIFSGSDFGIVNLECPLSERGNPILKSGPHVRADPRMIRLLTTLGVSGVTLANNHIRDYGDVGVRDTIDLCTANNIRVVGAGISSDLARRSLCFEAKGRKVAIINVVEEETFNAVPHKVVVNPLDFINLLSDIQQARSEADHVIVILHGGMEMTHCPSPKSVRLLRFLAEQGVTAVVRHHAHFVQGCETWRGVPILYGLGNLLFDQGVALASGWHNGLIVRLIIKPDNTCNAELYPIRQCDGVSDVTLLTGSARQNAVDAVDVYSSLLANPAALEQAWNEVVEAMRLDYYGRLFSPTEWWFRVMRRLKLLRFMHPGRHSAVLWATYLRSDTHREALQIILDQEYTTNTLLTKTEKEDV